jgi:hypothetical protein
MGYFGHVDEIRLDQLARQIAGRYRGRDPADSVTHELLDSTIARVRELVDRLNATPDQSPPYPPWPRHHFSATEAMQLKNAVVARLL